MNALLRDLQFALRQLRKSKGFAVVAVVTLALGIGANTAIFSVLDPLLLRNLPVANPDRLVTLSASGPVDTLGSLEEDFYRLCRDKNRVFSGVVTFTSTEKVPVIVSGVVGSLSDEVVSPNFFSVLGVRPYRGRLFVPEDALPGSTNIVISFDYWKRAFGSDPRVLGKTILANGIRYTIVGVTAPGFFGVVVGASPDFYIPAGAQLSNLDQWRMAWVNILARLKPGVSIAQAHADLEPIFEEYKRASQIPEIEKRNDMAVLNIVPAARGLSGLRERFSLPAQILMGVVGLILLIACANVGNLLLARGMARRREITVRLALGAGRWRIVRQLLTESALLAVVGTAAGLIMGNWGNHLLIAELSTKRYPISLDAGLSLRVFVFSAFVLILTVILCALAPALSATRADLAQDLKVQGASGSESTRRGRLGKFLVVVQVSFSVTVLIATGLLAHSLVNLETLNPGFDRDHILIVAVNRTATGVTNPQLGDFYSRLAELAKNLPGVGNASYSTFSPLSGTEIGINVVVEGYTLKPGETANELFVGVSPGYFDTMDIPLLTGRDFTAEDLHTKAAVVILNRTMAHRFFGDASPIGKHVRFVEGKRPPMEIVGVVADSKYNDLREKPMDFFYVPGGGGRVLDIRAAGSPATLIGPLRELIHSLDGSATIASVQTLRQQVDETLHQDYLVAGLCGVFSGLALALSCVGLYGTLSFSAARRTNEIGVRMALGATPRGIFQLIVGQGMRLTIAGLLLGVCGAMAGASLLASFLFQVKLADPVTLAGVCAIFIFAAFLACTIPAQRAMRVDPMTALREE
ncbi:MAG TPA: ABC transporter permease [Candidatus Acidoferrales bacterium]|nr:ABC transporter permease [Candidatus Acidoferrales bacterium]